MSTAAASTPSIEVPEISPTACRTLERGRDDERVEEPGDHHQESDGDQQLDQAEVLVTGLIGRAPNFAEAYNQRAIIYFHQGRFAESVRECQSVLSRNPAAARQKLGVETHGWDPLAEAAPLAAAA